ncbi:hypothetical protein MED222_04980 [Vibrio sp. MED222]|nr:hypothetical protein MED222_04980 [Vibrio sp. MED222]
MLLQLYSRLVRSRQTHKIIKSLLSAIATPTTLTPAI